MTVFEKIEAQQKGKENSAAWMVGQQLKDICRGDPRCAELVLQDLDNPEQSLEKAAEQIKAYADKQPRVNRCVVVPPNVAEDILRKFYGLPETSAAPRLTLFPQTDAAVSSVDLFDLL